MFHLPSSSPIFSSARLLGHREPDAPRGSSRCRPHRRARAGHVGEQPPHPRPESGCSAGASPTAGCAGRAEVPRRPRRSRARSGWRWRRADHRDPLAGEVDAVVPLRGMESGAREFVEPVDVGDQRDVQRAGARDEELGDVLPPVVGEHVPAILGVVPVRAVDVGVEPDVAAQTVLVGDALEVVQDLRLEETTCASSPASARTRTSTCATGCRTRSRDRCCRARCRRSRRPSPGSGSRHPALQRDGHPEAGESGADDQRAGVHRLLRRCLGACSGATVIDGVLPGNAGTGYFRLPGVAVLSTPVANGC